MKNKTYKLVIIRHGESLWNRENKFTGWIDVDLTEKGIAEAHKAATELKKNNFSFDLAFTSLLKRANKTLDIILKDMSLQGIEIKKSWRLNERHYGALQGLNKSDTAKKYGEDQVKKWRREYDAAIPPISETDPMYPGNDPLYSSLDRSEIPLSESLKDVVARVVPYWDSDIKPAILSGKQVIVAASGNSLRALIKYLDNISDQEIVEINIPTGIPLVYKLDENLKPVSKQYLSDPEELKKAMEIVTSQGKIK